MNDRWRRVRAILEGALDRTASERAEFVREASAGDVTIEREVIELLAADSAPNTIGGAIAEGVVSQVASGIASAAVLQPGAVVGRYRLVRVVGTGGMGAVWEAEQDDPKRPVALKVLQHAFALPTEVARFRFEAEVLGRLHHPHIAQVYEAGTFGSGQPFFAMEFVENARPLCGFANERGLDVRSKLDLLLAVADAVHHGHQRGVIHRDLKSANVLVDGHGHPKVIDFGIARGIGVEPGATPQLTRTGQMVGTLATMAPEQIEGKSEATDVRTDVYALGVILCELLTGKLPIDFTDVNLLEAARRIQCDPPVLPSAYDPSLPRELDWIAGKALAKEKARRYASASEFAADLRRFLDGEAVVAAPESRLYRARVFARRHRVGLIATVLVVVALASGLGVALQARSEEQIARTRAETSLALAKQARSEEQIARTRAETSLARAKSALAFVTGMLESVRPEEAGRDVRVRDVLLVADQDLQRGFNGPPEVEAAARASLGGSWLALDFTQEAETQLVRALELRERVLGKDDPETIDSLRALERLRARQGRMIETERLAAELTARSERVLGPDHPDTLLAHADHANALTMLGRGTEAESEVRDARARWPATLPPTDPRLIDVEKSLLTVLEYRKAGEEATRVAHDVYERVRSSFGPVHPRTLEAAGAYGRQLIGNGDRDGGLALMRTMLELHKKQLGPEHDHTLYAEESLLSCERYAGNLDTYCKRLEELIAVRERHDGPTYFRTLQDKGLLGIGLSQLGQYPKAIATLTGARDDALASAGADDPVTLQLSTWLAQAKLDSGDVEGAKADLRAALASPAVQADPTGARALALKESLGLTLRDPEHLAEGATLMREVLAARRAALGEGNELTLGAMLHLAPFEALAGDYPAAEALLREALAGFEKMFGRKHQATLATTQTLGTILSMSGRIEAAAVEQRAAMEIAAEIYGEGHPAWCDAASALGTSLRRLGKPADAEPLLARAEAGRAKVFGADGGLAVTSRIERTAALIELGRIADARIALGEADDERIARLAKSLSERHGGVAPPGDLATAGAEDRAFIARVADAIERTAGAAAAAPWRAPR